MQVTQFLMGDQTTMLCSEFTSGQTGVACLEEITTVEQIQATGDRPCSLSYNNVDCGSCSITASACVVSECSVHGIPSVNTCTNTGVDTIFQVLPYYTGASSPTALTVGGSAPAPVSVPVLPPVVAPTPVSTPVPVPVPVPAPVPVLEPVVTSTPVLGALTAAPTPSVVVETSAPTNSLSPVAEGATAAPGESSCPTQTWSVHLIYRFF